MTEKQQPQTLRKGEIFERFFASLPENGVQDWTWAECQRVYRTLKPCWVAFGLRGMMGERLHKRMWELRKLGLNHDDESIGSE